MKFKALFFATAALLAASCSNHETTISGTVAEDIDTVFFSVNDLKIKEAAPVVEGQFKMTLPVNEIAVGQLFVGRERRSFVLDGGALSVQVQEDGSYKYATKDPVSANGLLVGFYDEIMPRIDEINAKMMAWYQGGANQEAPEFEQINTMRGKLMEDLNQFVEDNITSAAILPVIQDFGLHQDDMVQFSEKLDPAFLENANIASIIKRAKAIEATAEGKMFVDFTIPDSEGKEVKFSEFIGKGKYVLVDFWASWCGPCRGEIPNLIKVYEKYHSEQFDVLGVAVWDKPEDSKAAAKKLGINYSEIINAQNIATDAYGIAGIPQIMLFGPDGTILKRDLRGEAIEAEVAKYVKPAK